MPFGNPIMSGAQLVRTVMQSENFVAGQSGWAIYENGDAYFYGLTVTGGTLIVSGASEGIFLYSGTPAAGNLIGAWSSTSGSDSYGNSYIGGLQIGAGGGNQVLANPDSGQAFDIGSVISGVFEALLEFTAPPAGTGGTITHVQDVVKTSTTGTVFTKTGITTTAGHLLVLVIGTSAAGPVSSITDSAGNTWNYTTALSNQDPPSNESPDGQWFTTIAWAENAASITSVTVTIASLQAGWFNLSEFAGVATSSAVYTANSYQAGATARSPSITTASAGELIVASCLGDKNPGGEGTGGWTAVNAAGNTFEQWMVASSAGAYTAPYTDNTDCCGAIVAFIPAGTTVTSPAVMGALALGTGTSAKQSSVWTSPFTGEGACMVLESQNEGGTDTPVITLGSVTQSGGTGTYSPVMTLLPYALLVYAAGSGSSLAMSFAAAGGTDQFGNTYPAGFKVASGYASSVSGTSIRTTTIAGLTASATVPATQPALTVTAATLTSLGTGTVPANDPVAGAVYELEIWGNGTWGSTAQTLELAIIYGGTTMSTITLGANYMAVSTAFRFRAVARVICLTTGSSGTWNSNIHGEVSVNGATLLTSGGSSANATNSFISCEAATSTVVSTTSAQTLELAAAWGSTTGTPTLTSRQLLFRRWA